MQFTEIITYVVAATVWMTPMPKHSQGLLVLYGNERLSEANAQYRGYSLDGFKCGLAAMSPADLGKVVWIRTGGRPWYGPCLSVDTSARKDFYANVYVRGEIAEVDIRGAIALEFKYGVVGEAYVGLCPPRVKSIPKWYEPKLKIDYWTANDSYLHSFWPYQKQQYPIDCDAEAEKKYTECWTPLFIDKRAKAC